MDRRMPEEGSAIHALAELIERFEIRDLSHTLEPGIPTFPTHSHYYHLAWEKPGDPALMYQILMHEHNGTHVDAPAHYIAGGPDPERHYMHHVAADALIGSAVLIDVSDNGVTLVERDVIEAWEGVHGKIEAGGIVIFNFGWHLKWKAHDPEQSFLNPWPGLARDAVLYLLELGVKAVGTDCLGLDAAGSVEIPAHDLLLVNSVLIMENLANLGGLPSRFFFVATPLKIFEGSGSPIRALALVPREASRSNPESS